MQLCYFSVVQTWSFLPTQLQRVVLCFLCCWCPVIVGCCEMFLFRCYYSPMKTYTIGGGSGSKVKTKCCVNNRNLCCKNRSAVLWNSPSPAPILPSQPALVCSWSWWRTPSQTPWLTPRRGTLPPVSPSSHVCPSCLKKKNTNRSPSTNHTPQNHKKTYSGIRKYSLVAYFNIL